MIEMYKTYVTKEFMRTLKANAGDDWLVMNYEEVKIAIPQSVIKLKSY